MSVDTPDGGASTADVAHYRVQLVPPLSTDGAFGQVFAARDMRTERRVAVKRVLFADEDGRNDVMAQLAFREVKNLQSIAGHAHIVELLYHHIDAHSYWLFMELCELGHLGEYLEQRPDLRLPAKLGILRGVSDAIAFMHARRPPLVHRDIKLQNILMTEQQGRHVPKVVDFNLSRMCESRAVAGRAAATKAGGAAQCLQSVVGTPAYMAPEFYLELESGVQYDASVDVYALGLVFTLVLAFSPQHQRTRPQSSEYRTQPRHITLISVERASVRLLDAHQTSLSKYRVYIWSLSATGFVQDGIL